MGELTLRGDYRVIRPVGKGSYGEVILVQHLEQGRKFVIKKLKLQNASRRERKAAEQEAQLLSRLKHPNIVAYRESWEGEDGMLYIVMGFCEGGDLYHKLKEQKGKLLPECQVMDWFIQIAMALQYLHEEHVMHRDLKTQNIFLTRSNIIKVGDLGIARVLESQNDMASTLIGTPYYMSPELFSNKPYNYKSDVWALGCCVYEMTTLKHAFNAKDMNSLVFRIIEGKLPPMTKNYSEDLGELIRKMLSQQPEKRPSVKQILRKPFIKHHIALFLQATKQNHCKHKKKIPNSSTSNINGNGDPHGIPSVQRLDCDLAQRPVKKKEKDIMKKKPVDTPPDAAHRSLNHTGTSVATLSNVDINFCPAEKNLSSHPIPTAETPDRITKEPGRSVAEIRSHTAHDRNSRSAPLHLTNSMAECVGTMELPSNEDLDSTEKLLEPFVPVMVLDIESPKATCPVPHSSLSEPSLSRQRRHQDQDVDSQLEMECPRPSPSPPAAEHKATNPVHREMEKQDSLEQIQSFEFRQRVNSQDQRPLSARERRRLKQSQEDIFTSGPANRRDSSHSVGMDSNWPRSLQASDENKDHFVQRLSEDELSSSTSSTDRSEGDYKDRHRKSDSSEMQDLVQLMTQTLHMGKDQSENAAAQCNEFKMHRKYRDTLVLHGKAAEEPDGFHFHHFPSDNVTVPEKFRRMVESLRADVVQGVGVKVLERVYDIMEREDETDRELQLKNHLGDKYDPYGLKIQQLKFFEDNSKF